LHNADFYKVFIVQSAATAKRAAIRLSNRGNNILKTLLENKFMKYVEPLARLIAELTKLPGVGEKTAARYAYKILNSSPSDIEKLITAISDVKSKVHFCKICGNFSEEDICEVCATRPSDVICVVKEPKDIIALEKVKDFKGVYHVLHGVISPMEGVGPEQLKIKELLARLGKASEVIIATNPDVEGEATAMYLAKLIKPLGVKVTRIARGLPEGSIIEYADESTLSRALRSRIEM
jgi:recombination protein RecR